MESKTLVEKLDEIAVRTSHENMVFLRPRGAIVALSKIMERKEVSPSVVQKLLEDIHDSLDEIDNLLWTVPQSRSLFRKLIVQYLNENQHNDDLLEGFLRYFQEKPMTNELKNKLAVHLSENSLGLDSALTIWSKLHRL